MIQSCCQRNQDQLGTIGMYRAEVVVSVVSFYSDDSNSNPAEVRSLSSDGWKRKNKHKDSVTRLGYFLDFGQLFKAFGNN